MGSGDDDVCVSCPCEDGSSADQPPAVTLATVLSGDLAALVVDNLDQFQDVAALLAVFIRAPPPLIAAAASRGAAILGSDALCADWSVTFNFEAQALWPDSVSAARWHPVQWLAALRAPPVCKVTGSGRCAHGLCQKQDIAALGVMPLLKYLSSSELMCPAAGGCSVQVLALECIARLNGALGRNEMALHEWRRAARVGSARAQLEIGIRQYKASDSSAATMLRRAVNNEGSVGVERQLIRAQAALHLGYMALDGDGETQDDMDAVLHFRQARTHCQITPAPGAPPDLVKQLASLEASARNALEDIERFTFYANGRP